MARGRANQPPPSINQPNPSGLRHDGDQMLSYIMMSGWQDGPDEHLLAWEDDLRKRGQIIFDQAQGDLSRCMEVLSLARAYGAEVKHCWDPQVSEMAKELLEAAGPWFPREWLQRSHKWAEVLPIQVWLDENETHTLAAYTHEDPMGGSGFYLTRRLFQDPAFARAVLLHEWAHRMEALVPDIKVAAWIFRQRRHQDPVKHEYAWKTYGDGGPDRHNELFASGMEALSGGSPQVQKDLLIDDPDYRNWLLGVLATI